MLCCRKTGVKVTRCRKVITSNLNSPDSIGESEHDVILLDRIALAPQSSQHQDNYDEAGRLTYRTYLGMIANSTNIKVSDWLEYNTGQLGLNTFFDSSKDKTQGMVYSVRELIGSRKFWEIKIRINV